MGDAGSWWAIAEQAAMLHGAGPWGVQGQLCPQQDSLLLHQLLTPWTPSKTVFSIPS